MGWRDMNGVEPLLVLTGTVTGYGIARAADWVARRQGDTGWAVAHLPVAAAGALVALAALLLGPASLPLLCLTLAFGLCLLALAVIDLKTLILPDGLNLTVLLLGAGWSHSSDRKPGCGILAARLPDMACSGWSRWLT